MSARTGYPNGVPSWVDLASPDVDASVAFYRGLFGWEHVASGPVEETGGYGVFTLRGRNVAGIVPLQDESQPAVWNTYIAVDDADATVAAAEQAGGQVAMGVLDVMTSGRMAYLVDTTGAMVGIWQAGDHIGAQLVNEPGTLGWNELTTQDFASAKAFYASVVGWEPEAVEGSNGGYVVFNVDGHAIAGMIGARDGAASQWRVYFIVADTDATVARAQALGGAITVPAFDLEDIGRIAMLSDPNGTAFAVMTPVSADE